MLLFSSDHKHCLKCLHLLCSSFVAVLSVLFKHSNIVHKTKETNSPTFATEFFWKLLFSISFKIYFLIDSKIFHQTFTGAHGKYKIISFLSLKSILCWLHTTEKIFISKTLRLSGSIQFDVVKEMYYTDNKPPWTFISLQVRLSFLCSVH